MKLQARVIDGLNQVVLEKIYFEVEQNVSEYAAMQLDIESYIDIIGHGVAFKFRTAIFEENVGKSFF
jgi:hypothetical protein